MNKFCKNCNTTKFIEDFPKNKSSKDGYHSECKICANQRGKKWRIQNPELTKERYKKVYYKNKEKELERVKQYKKDNKETISISKKKWNKLNKNAINLRRAKRRKEDELYKLSQTVRNLTNYAFKRLKQNKSSKTLELLGTDWKTLKLYIESQFKEGMSWENHGEWHIDHIKPICSAKKVEDLKEICFYKNLRPLWAIDNQIKNGKYYEIQ